MSSESKKRKARNSYMYNGGEKTSVKLRRINYYKKRDRVRINREVAKGVEGYDGERQGI